MHATALQRLDFFVPGQPRPQGSKRHVGGGQVVESSAYLPGWRRAVALVARNAAARQQWRRARDAVRVDLLYLFVQPKSNRAVWPVARWVGDLDKLTRAISDGLVDAGAIDDDSLVVQSCQEKAWGSRAGVRVTISEPLPATETAPRTAADPAVTA